MQKVPWSCLTDPYLALISLQAEASFFPLYSAGGRKSVKESIFRSSADYHPRRPRGSQSGREKRRDESFQVRAKEPLGTDSHRTITKNSSGCWLLIGHKKCIVLLCPIGEHISWVLFVCSYTTAVVSNTACLAHAPKKCKHSGNFPFDIKSPSDFKILSARKLKALSKNTSLSLQQVFTLDIGHVLRKY